MNKEEGGRHRFEAWFGLPVCVQLRSPYVVPRYEGETPVEVEDADGNKKILQYGRPFIRGDEGNPGQVSNAILAAITGELQPDGDGVMLYAEMAEVEPEARLDTNPPTVGTVNKTYKLRIALDYRDIAYVTVIPEPRANSPLALS